MIHAANRSPWSRRDWMKMSGLSLLGASSSGWLSALAARAAEEPSTKPKRHCILLWMAGGPAQTDTFDMKPEHANGGEFSAIETNVPGIRISQHLPQLALHAEKLALVRSLSTKEGDHGRGTYLMRTGRQPQGPIAYPSIGAVLGKELGDVVSGVPRYVSISPFQVFNPAAWGPGFLGPRFAPLTVGAVDSPQARLPLDEQGFAQLRVDNLSLPAEVSPEQFQKRLAMWRAMQDRFLAQHASAGPQAQDTIARRAIDMMSHDVVKAFNLADEPNDVREAYGRGRFGQGCLLARRLIEQGVPFVEVTLGAAADNAVGWDTHQGNFPAVQRLSEQLDAGWAKLMEELADRGLLESTTILWIGEFGRTPRINASAGRDHFPAAWTCVFAGGGIRGGTVHGRTSDDGTEVTDGKVDVGDVLATLCASLGLDHERANVSPEGRPIKLAEGQPIRELLKTI